MLAKDILQLYLLWGKPTNQRRNKMIQFPQNLNTKQHVRLLVCFRDILVLFSPSFVGRSFPFQIHRRRFARRPHRQPKDSDRPTDTSHLCRRGVVVTDDSVCRGGDERAALLRSCTVCLLLGFVRGCAHLFEALVLYEDQQYGGGGGGMGSDKNY